MTKNEALAMAREFYAYASMAFEYFFHPENYPEAKKYGNLPDIDAVADLISHQPGRGYPTKNFMRQAYPAYVYSWLMKSAGLSYDLAGKDSPNDGEKPYMWDTITIDFPVQTISQPVAPAQQHTVNNQSAVANEFNAAVDMLRKQQAVAAPPAPAVNSTQVPQVQMPVPMQAFTTMSPTPVVPNGEKQEKQNAPTKPTLVGLAKEIGEDSIKVEKIDSAKGFKNVWKGKMTLPKVAKEYYVLVDEDGEIITNSPKIIILAGEHDSAVVKAVELKKNALTRWATDPVSYVGCIDISIFDLYLKKVFDFAPKSAERIYKVQRVLSGFSKSDIGKALIARFSHLKTEFKDDVLSVLNDNNEILIQYKIDMKDPNKSRLLYINQAYIMLEENHQQPAPVNQPAAPAAAPQPTQAAQAAAPTQQQAQAGFNAGDIKMTPELLMAIGPFLQQMLAQQNSQGAAPAPTVA